MGHIAGVGVGGAKPRRVGGESVQAPIRIVLQQGRRQDIGCRRVGARHEFRRGHSKPALLAGNIRRVRISPEKIVESSVLGNDDHDVLDRCSRIFAMVVQITISGVKRWIKAPATQPMRKEFYGYFDETRNTFRGV